MNQYEVPQVLAEEFPEVNKELRHLAVLGNANASMNILSSFTREMIITHHFREVRHCFQVADKIYEKGDAVVKTAVENVFVYSFTQLRCSCNKVEWHMVRAVMPSRLFLLYLHQVNAASY